MFGRNSVFSSSSSCRVRELGAEESSLRSPETCMDEDETGKMEVEVRKRETAGEVCSCIRKVECTDCWASKMCSS